MFDQNLKNYLKKITIGVVLTVLIILIQGIAFKNSLHMLSLILNLGMSLLCIYILVINHIFMVKNKYFKINILNWFFTIFMLGLFGTLITERGYYSSGTPIPIALLASILSIFISIKQSINRQGY